MLKVGDKVTIKKFTYLNMPKHIVTLMYDYFGKTLTISEIDNNEYTFQECPNWYWFESDFKDINEFKLDDKLFEV